MVSGYINTEAVDGYDRYWLSLSEKDFDPPSMINIIANEKDIKDLNIENGRFYTIVGFFESCAKGNSRDLYCTLSIKPIRKKNGELSIRKRL